MSEKPLRTFVAVLPEPGVRSQITECVRRIKKNHWADRVKWVPDENIHVTLKFLGDTPREILPDLIQTMESRVKMLSPFDISFSGIIALPSPSKPRVIAIETDPCQELTDLAREVELATVQYGYEPEKRKFRGHTTIGRCRKPISGKLSLMSERVDTFTMHVSEISLMKSELHSTGAVYSSLRVMRFQS